METVNDHLISLEGVGLDEARRLARARSEDDSLRHARYVNADFDDLTFARIVCDRDIATAAGRVELAVGERVLATPTENGTCWVWSMRCAWFVEAHDTAVQFETDATEVA